MHWLFEDAVGLGTLDELAGPHDRDVTGQLHHHRQAVRTKV
jgi:hypothetical protein